MANIPQSALTQFIKTNHIEYYGKICELREAIEDWLSYIPNTFPHYTRHTIKHSDTIVSQMSGFLFKDDDFNKPVVSLSGVEAYILVAAAYLHDAGMVTSNKEKSEILASESWKKWTTGDGGGAKRWKEIQELRNAKSDDPKSTEAVQNFLADVQIRFLIAEHIRSQHHTRAGSLIEVHHDQLGRVDFGDHMLRTAIAQVCVGHGLKQHELEDNSRFPDARDIRGEKVNLRFLAIVLRLGDLLDMSIDRACPLLLNAASPLPPDSLAHWTQYNCIVHRWTSPETIEVTAECTNQEEHRVLKDWCQWIADEVKNANILMPKMRRHNDWRFPEAKIEGDNPSIKIRPRAGATYIPSNWTLQFDQQAIFERLSDNLYSEPLTFIRELIQNGLDAMRCKMFLDLQNDGQPVPEYSTQVSEDIRQRYSLKLSISEIEVENKLSGEMETKQVLVVEDNGIGMDTEIIEKYFLQVGRSFYVSDEFRQKFSFTATSRFGIGFLSVFAASDKVTVETYKPSAEIPDNKPLKITLTGFRNYLLHEKSDKKTSGTRIEIFLRENIEKEKLKEVVSNWCRRVEFPIEVVDFGEKSTIVAERPEDFIYEQLLFTDPKGKFVVKAFPINELGFEGEIYVHALVNKNGEWWNKSFYLKDEYRKSHPLAKAPNFIGGIVCFHGIKTDNRAFQAFFRDINPLFSFFSVRIDIRDKSQTLDLNRSNLKLLDANLKEMLEAKIDKILIEHLDTCKQKSEENFLGYKRDLAFSFQHRNFWWSYPSLIEIQRGKLQELTSFEKINELVEFDLEIMPRHYSIHRNQTNAEKKSIRRSQIPVIKCFEGYSIITELWKTLVNSKYTPIKIISCSQNRVCIRVSSKSPRKSVEPQLDFLETFCFQKISSDNSLVYITQSIFDSKNHSVIFINENNEVGKWLKFVNRFSF